MALLDPCRRQQENQIDYDDEKRREDEEKTVAEGCLSFGCPLSLVSLEQNVVLQVMEELEDPADESDELAEARNCV